MNKSEGEGATTRHVDGYAMSSAVSATIVCAYIHPFE
jgi:hypothetical protein